MVTDVCVAGLGLGFRVVGSRGLRVYKGSLITMPLTRSLFFRIS